MKSFLKFASYQMLDIYKNERDLHPQESTVKPVPVPLTVQIYRSVYCNVILYMKA